ncbi:TetR family transcriptional regulator C-terminal domain-containing protein [Pseudonocardia sp. KRD291]|uniref:TetR family transcriptional regulator C-terminal domain-containing protein n=1 Tax=Pseudonocardia sp. KRD291 TaxID=2792007 RepID=UPI001C5C4E05|nr:TetR family transcriptional regulator C-terminal domain-containing protein [Pseudonocardia sp. KRD291]MBW0102082.1 TetR family transcriptional regulator C-terminal domain-containing protein [Pseudonocardia sp. KRD291]
MRRRELIDAVLAVAATRGVPAVSQTSVAAAAGVSAGRVQHYFSTMADLLGAAFDHVNAISSARISVAVGGDLENAPPRRVLEVVLTELIPHDEPSRAHLQFRQSFTALALHHEDIAARLRGQYRQLHHHDLAALVRRDQEAGLIASATNPESAATSLAALAEGLAYYVLIGVVEAADARVQVLDALAQLYQPSTVED